MRQIAALLTFYMTHLFQSARIQPLCFVLGNELLKLILVQKIRLRKGVKGCHVFYVSGVCDHKVSQICHSHCMLKIHLFDPASTAVLPQYQYKNTAVKGSRRPLMFLYFFS